MTPREAQADELRRAQARERLGTDRALLPWVMLKPSEQRQWLDRLEGLVISDG